MPKFLFTRPVIKNKNICTVGLDKYNRLKVQWPPRQNIASIKNTNLK
jgi:hypothetical protein